MSLKSKESKGPMRLISAQSPEAQGNSAPALDASVLAKLAEDVIAWNRQLGPSKPESEARPARVARLDSLRCGLKILRKEESPVGELRPLFKE